MKVKIINSNSEDYQKELKLRRMNYDQVVVNYPGGKGIKVFDKLDVEFITESEIDEFLIKYSDFLKIKLNRGISVVLYKAILDTIENELKINFNGLNLLKEKYAVNKRGIWEKEILCVINENMPIKIIADGQNFKKSGFNINIEEVEKEEFLEICAFEIKKINKEIKEKEDLLKRYGEGIEKIKNPTNPVKMLV
ncbi:MULTISPECIES: hypothetical protein [unclassified Clostridium]|uniref:hypothetical protein n=1 Tax=unclassified Clostridium TaxID=2614128 RepID=UPI001C8B76FB|nr:MULTISPECIES: hypothetical protein [unclassified Clostridium]MBX9139363.1 hypothetical protein [Clostridium sp. K12(2020)]MBX9146103.1 hypothetical protein [Clostridium sp. K13]